MSGWDNFFVAQAGAAAALAGLVFVAVSLNLKRILELDGLPARAGETVIQLMALLAIAMMGLVPGQPAFPWLLIGIGSVTVLSTTLLQLRAPAPRLWFRIVRVFSNQVPAALCAIAGIALRCDTSCAGWLAAGVVLGFAGAMINAWVLLVEIQR